MLPPHQYFPRYITRSKDIIEGLPFDANSVQKCDNMVIGPGCVGYQDQRLSTRTQLFHALQHAWIRVMTIVHHSPEIKNVGVVIHRDTGEPGQEFWGH